MAKYILPKGSTDSRTHAVLVAAEVMYDRDLQRFFGGDGVTQGGLQFVFKKDLDAALANITISGGGSIDTNVIATKDYVTSTIAAAGFASEEFVTSSIAAGGFLNSSAVADMITSAGTGGGLTSATVQEMIDSAISAYAASAGSGGDATPGPSLDAGYDYEVI